MFFIGPSASQCQTLPSSDGADLSLILLRNNYNPNKIRVRSAAPTTMQNIPSPGVYNKLMPYLGWILETLKP